MIPKDDERFLGEKQYPHEITQVGPEIYVVLKAWPFPIAYTPQAADVLIRLFRAIQSLRLTCFGPARISS